MSVLQSIYNDQELHPLTPEEYNEQYDTIKPAPYVYTTYFFPDLNYKPGNRAAITYFGDVSFLIDTRVLQDRPFYACNGTVYGLCTTYRDLLITKGRGRLKRPPSLTKLRAFINKDLDDERAKKRYNGLQAYLLSHEVLVDKIPLSYVFAILLNTSHISKAKETKIRELFKTIPIFSLNVNVPSYAKKIEKIRKELGDPLNGKR